MSNPKSVQNLKTAKSYYKAPKANIGFERYEDKCYYEDDDLTRRRFFKGSYDIIGPCEPFGEEYEYYMKRKGIASEEEKNTIRSMMSGSREDDYFTAVRLIDFLSEFLTEEEDFDSVKEDMEQYRIRSYDIPRAHTNRYHEFQYEIRQKIMKATDMIDKALTMCCERDRHYRYEVMNELL